MAERRRIAPLKKVDPNQINLFADFGMEIIKPELKAVKRTEYVSDNITKTDKEMTLWFAKQCKQSLAFLDCVLNGTLPGDYHGTKLWIRRFGNSWTNEIIENSEYWISKGYKVFESKETICLIQI